MPLPTVDELITAFDQKRQTDLGAAESRLFKEHGLEALVPGFIAAFSRIRNAAGRNCVLFWLLRFARKYPEVGGAGEGRNERSCVHAKDASV